jgi:hypothetical protein
MRTHTHTEATSMQMGDRHTLMMLHLALAVALLLCVMPRAWPQSRDVPLGGLGATSCLAAVYVNIAPDSAETMMTATVGDTIRLTLTVVDLNGAAITDWNTTGSVVHVAARNSIAEMDTSVMSWNADNEGFTWMKLLDASNQEFAKSAAAGWLVPAAMFVDGVAHISFIDTRAEDDVYLVAWTDGGASTRSSAGITFRHGTIAHILVDLTSATANHDPGQVYAQRPFELVVTPRDRYLNPIDSAVDVIFTARFPQEFDTTRTFTDAFIKGMRLTGATSVILTPNIDRQRGSNELQTVTCRVAGADILQGRSESFEVLEHAPNPFALLFPLPSSVYVFVDGQRTLTFSWVKAAPQDPYTDIQISRFSPEAYSDNVRYTVVFADSPVVLPRRVRIPSDDSGRANVCTLSYARISAIIDTIFQNPSLREAKLTWWVEATDSLYVRPSFPPDNDPNRIPGWPIIFTRSTTGGIEHGRVPSADLGSPMPNPFIAGTSLPFRIDREAQVRVDVFNSLGACVATVLQGRLPSGEHHAFWNGLDLVCRPAPAGVYLCRMEARMSDGRMFTRTRAVVKTR